jgi:proline dehydrogenase
VKTAVLSDSRLRGVARRIALRYIGGESREEALDTVRRINALGDAATVDYMGESTRERDLASAATGEFVATAAAIAERGLDCSLSLDLSHIGLVIDTSFCLENARHIAAATVEADTEMMISMEGFERVDAILDLHAALARDHENVGITLQARLHRATADLDAVLERRGSIRLVKGAYEAPAEVALAREDERLAGRYLKLARQLIESGHPCSIATQDEELLDEVAAMVDPSDTSTLEFEVLLGLGDNPISKLRDRGYRTRQYIVYGEEWFLYVCNRIAEEPERIYQAVTDAVP